MQSDKKHVPTTSVNRGFDTEMVSIPALHTAGVEQTLLSPSLHSHPAQLDTGYHPIIPSLPPSTLLSLTQAVFDPHPTFSSPRILCLSNLYIHSSPLQSTPLLHPTLICLSPITRARVLDQDTLLPPHCHVSNMEWTHLLPFEWMKMHSSLVNSSDHLYEFECVHVKDRDATYIVFTLHQSLYYVPLYHHITSFTLQHIPIASVSFAHVGGVNQTLVAYVRHQDLYVTTWEGIETQLTSTVLPGITQGRVEYVVQEEFHRSRGYEWATVSDPLYPHYERIFYIQVDEREVEYVSVAEKEELEEPMRLRYPRAGQRNASFSLCLVLFQPRLSQSSEAVIIHQTLHPDYDLKGCFPWAEYLVRLGWMPMCQSVWVMLMDRRQRQLALVEIPVTLFVEKGQAPKGHLRVLYEESVDSYWLTVPHVNFIDSLHFCITREGSRDSSVYIVSCPEPNTPLTHTEYCNCKLVLLTQQGVIDDILSVDTVHQCVYFMARKDSPLESHLYVVSYHPDSLGVCRRLTELGYSYSITMNDPCTWYFATCSNTVTPPCFALYHIQHTEEGVIVQPSTCVTSQDVPSVPIPRPGPRIGEMGVLGKDFPLPEIFSFMNSDGIQLYGIIYRPFAFQPTRSYPTLIHIYGGPLIQCVVNEYKSPSELRLLYALYFGCVVVVMDSRGSAGRGRDFERCIADSFMTGLQDQVEGIVYLLESTMKPSDHLLASHTGLNARFEHLCSLYKQQHVSSWMDPTRIYMMGWSFGGYMSLLALIEYPSIFAKVIAGAPVVNWEWYDTAYTERYFGLPQEHPDKYKQSNLLNHIDRFPTSRHRLLLVHGYMDDNVHFRHSQALSRALDAHQRPHSFQIYSKEDHAILRPESVKHMETVVLDFLF